MEPDQEISTPNENNENSKIEQKSIRSDERSKKKIDESYLKKVVLIVDDSYDLSSQKTSADQKVAKAKSWADTFYGIIPEDQLHNAFKAALRVHLNSLPVNGYEILKAWSTLEQEIRKEDYTQPDEQISKCREWKNHIDNFGNCRYVDPSDFSREIVVPCFTCRNRDFEAFRFQHNRTHASDPKTKEGFAEIVKWIEKWADEHTINF